jgi:hypothetical protein
MPLTVIATPGASNANSFVTVAEADAYVDAQMERTGWPVAADDKARALFAATADISALDFVGSRTATAQALAWPRIQAPNPDARNDNGWPYGIPTWSQVFYGDDVVPQRVKDATCELAYRYAVAGAPSTGVVPADNNIIEKQIDVLRTRWAEPGQRAVGLGLYPKVAQWLKPLLATGTSLTVSRR